MLFLGPWPALNSGLAFRVQHGKTPWRSVVSRSKPYLFRGRPRLIHKSPLFAFLSRRAISFFDFSFLFSAVRRPHQAQERAANGRGQVAVSVCEVRHAVREADRPT